MRWVVGDIQGCAREFEELLRVVRFDGSHDELWIIGDLINRGPDSLAAARLWRDIGGKGVLGNHEVYALLLRTGRWPREPRDTLDELFAASDADELLDRLRALPALAALPREDGSIAAWLVHGGLSPLWTDLPATAARINPEPHDDDWLESPEVNFATHVRFCNAQGERDSFTGPPAQAPEGYRPWDEFYSGETLVVHGHWARRRFYRGPRTLGLDSGCVYGDELTAWCPEEDRLVRIPSRMRVR
jgi:bis(5'-nucleosyl)-tetraphosphatase (symmetrical)